MIICHLFIFLSVWILYPFFNWAVCFLIFSLKSSSYILVTSALSDRRRQWHLTPVLLPGKSHGRRSLVGSSPWGLTELDTTEQLHFHFSLSCIGEGNGNPLQCSCLENPGDGEAWWAPVYGVAQSRTRLKWLSSSSSFIRYAFGNYFVSVCGLFVHSLKSVFLRVDVFHFNEVQLINFFLHGVCFPVILKSQTISRHLDFSPLLTSRSFIIFHLH